MEYHFEIFEEEDGGFWAESVELKGCLSDGKTLEELKSRLEDALNLYLNEPPGSSQVFPLPDKKLDRDERYIRIPVQPNIAFALLVRHYRISRNLTLEQAQKRIGLKNRNSYVRLETPGNPTMESISLVKKAFPEINLNDCF
ncbi:type II toxin-antitoxin system HicB family antitoxin [Spirochaeta isovalerica]|uniref:Putative RNase H-like HicB family nuclease n=1 Tax=Spirochaeta isovalerica TaxID=150 RepID=A0A841REP9_9SPIO|nr:type II toxin-antitoxin system HicB family antitoxin [Spirochaeta isovalerica]MBB6481861.1 putative RNase H-like HicB family nuclease [Spirochaeta isovalerica]